MLLMRTMVLTASDRTVVGAARIDESCEPWPRAVLARRPGSTPSLFARVVEGSLARHRLITQDAEVASALTARGATVLRASRLMVLSVPKSIGGRLGSHEDLVGPVQDTPSAYGELYVRAYPPEHPDHDPREAAVAGAARTISRYLNGTDVGPLNRAASGEARSADGVVVGVIIVSELAGDEEYEGGAWLTQLFVDPRRHGCGIGTALIRHAVGQLDLQDRQALGLAVTSGSPACRVYERLGFKERFESWALFIDA